jgi:hypothetical protein
MPQRELTRRAPLRWALKQRSDPSLVPVLGASVSLAGHLSLNQVTVITDLLRAKDLVLLGSLERMVSGYL